MCILVFITCGSIRKRSISANSDPIANAPGKNDVSFLFWRRSGGKIKIPLKTADAKDRVLGTNESLQSVLDNSGPLVAWKYLSFLVWITPARLSYWLSFSNVSLFRYRSSMSCIPQSPEQYCLLGQPITHVYHIPMIKDSVPQAGTKCKPL